MAGNTKNAAEKLRKTAGQLRKYAAQLRKTAGHEKPVVVVDRHALRRLIHAR